MNANATQNNASAQSFQIRLGGSGGQGLQLSAKILARAFVDGGMFVSQSQSYEPTSRGGLSRSDLVAGPEQADFPLATDADFVLVLDQVAVKSAEIVKAGGCVVTDARLAPDAPAGDFTVRALPITDKAIELGNPRVANVVALGVLDALGGLCGRERLEGAVRALTPAKFRDLNIEALAAGYAMAEDLETAA